MNLDTFAERRLAAATILQAIEDIRWFMAEEFSVATLRRAVEVDLRAEAIPVSGRKLHRCMSAVNALDALSWIASDARGVSGFLSTCAKANVPTSSVRASVLSLVRQKARTATQRCNIEAIIAWVNTSAAHQQTAAL
jgi:hypothetical protein